MFSVDSAVVEGMNCADGLYSLLRVHDNVDA